MEENLNTVDAVRESVVDSQTEQVETTVGSVNADNVDVTTDKQEETKPVQSPEENAKFAEVRRKAAEEARAKARDEVISEMYGETHGIHTYAEYQEALARQEEEQRLAKMQAQGIEPDLIKQYAEDLPEVKEAKQLKRDRESMAALAEIAPEITDASQIPEEVLRDYVQGKDLASSYAIWKLKTDRETKAAEAAKTAKSEEIARANAENAKSSTGSISGDGVANDGYFTKEQVDRMTKAEVLKNYDQILKSTSKWQKEVINECS